MEVEYLQKCLQNYLNDEFEVEEALYLFSYLLKSQIADKLTTQFKETSQHLINIDWISQDGKILVGLDEAQQKASEVLEEIEKESKN